MALASPPDGRLAYDEDGTIVVWTSDTLASVEATDNQRALLNDEEDTIVWGAGSPPSPWGGSTRPPNSRIGFMFPQPMNLTHVFFVGGSAGTVADCEFSTDTTNLEDGTWTATPLVGVDPNGTNGTLRRFRVNLAAFSSPAPTGIVAIRWRIIFTNNGFFVRGVHLYGEPVVPVDGLSLWDPTTDVKLEDGAGLDWGDVKRITTDTKTFRVKNMSGTDTAQGVEVSIESLTPATPPLEGMHEFSLDDTTYTETASLGDLDPGEISPVIYVKRTTTSDAQFGTWALRIKAAATAWV